MCPKCHGIGWLVHDVPPGHALFGSRGMVRCDVCGEGREQAYLQALCGLSGEMLGWDWDNTDRNPTNAAAYDTAQALAAQPSSFYTLLGKFGVGKTRLLTCIVNAGRLAGHTAVYTTTAALLDYLRSAYNPETRGVTFDGRWETITTARILAVDEFDRWNPTDWAREKFEQLIDTRYRNKTTQLTAFAANAALSALPGYVASRMLDRSCYLFELTGADVRRLMR